MYRKASEDRTENMNTTEKEAYGVGMITKEEAKQLHEIQQRFIDAYKAKKPENSDYDWLHACYKKELPEWKEENIANLTRETLDTVAEYDKNLRSAEEAAQKGISSEKWFADKVVEAGKGVAINEFGQQLAKIDRGLMNGNAQMLRTVTTQSGTINQNPNLHGFIAEQHHVNTFNANAVLKNSNYRAEVKVPAPGETYGKNSFDIVIRDLRSGKIVQQYQSKCGMDASHTISDFRKGNYTNQRFLVPSGQGEAVQAEFPGKTVSEVLGGAETGGVTSNPLSVEETKLLQNKVQEKGQIPQIDYNDFQIKDLARHIGQNAGMAGLHAAALAGGMTLFAATVCGEHVDSDGVIEVALTSGADASVKAAAAGAIKVGAEKGVLSMLPPGTPVQIIANIACVGIENAKILAKVASGELTLNEALDKMGRTTTSMVYGLGWGAAGMTAGAAALSWIPIVGPIVGGLAGGMIGYMAGSKVGETIYQGAKKVASVAKKAVTTAWESVSSFGKKIGSSMKSIGRRARSFLGL